MSAQTKAGYPKGSPMAEVAAKLDLSQAMRWSRLALPHIFERGGLDHEKPALIFNSQIRTYGDMREQSRRFAHVLIGLGIEPGERVAVLSSNRIEYLEIETGIASARAIMVPLNWRLRPPETAAILNRAGARAIVAESRFVPAITQLKESGAVPQLEIFVEISGDCSSSWLNYEGLMRDAPGTPVPRSARLEDPHEIIFTSGTTGKPKGVVWTNGGVLFNSLQQVIDFRLGPDCSSYTIIDLYYIGGRHDFTWSILQGGGTVHIKESSGFDARQILRYTCENKITHILWVPTMIYEILRVADLKAFDTSSLQTIMCGGQPLSAEAVKTMREKFPHTDFIQVYGLTEGGGSVTCMPANLVSKKPGSCGRPSAHVSLRITDPEDNDVPAGTDGEILIRAPSISAGYWDDPELTSIALADDWLRTGDIGHLDEDGFLYVTGRKKDMIISGGMNIFPSEIEDVLRSHPAVADVSVIGVPHEKWGEQVCAVIEVADGHNPSEADLVAFCAGRLASFKKPSIIHFVQSLPRTSSGKPQKFVLREIFGSGEKPK